MSENTQYVGCNVCGRPGAQEQWLGTVRREPSGKIVTHKIFCLRLPDGTELEWLACEDCQDKTLERESCQFGGLTLTVAPTTYEPVGA
jgi:hypothetical protein